MLPSSASPARLDPFSPLNLPLDHSDSLPLLLPDMPRRSPRAVLLLLLLLPVRLRLAPATRRPAFVIRPLTTTYCIADALLSLADSPRLLPSVKPPLPPRFFQISTLPSAARSTLMVN